MSSLFVFEQPTVRAGRASAVEGCGMSSYRSKMRHGAILDRIRDFVCGFDNIRGVQLEAVPYPLDSHEGIAYLLMVASINQGTSAERVRDLMRSLYDRLGDELLHFHSISSRYYVDVLEQFRDEHWNIWAEIPKILSSASKFIPATERYGGLVERGRKQPDTETAADRIARNIYYMGKNPEGARKKVWMFMRWMVRPFPDIGVWNPPLSPADLRIPLDANTGRAFLDMCHLTPLADRMKDEGIELKLDERGRIASTAMNVESLTAVARWFFPNDPARVDHAFFCYGRRYSRGEDSHRCWNIVSCTSCPIRDLVRCRGKR
jgi:hypothetical protein